MTLVNDTPAIHGDQLAVAARSRAAIIEAHKPMEHLAGHVPGAEVVPMGQLSSRAAAKENGR